MSDRKSSGFSRNLRQGLKVAFGTFFVAGILSANSQFVLTNLELPIVALVLLVLVVLVGIIFDIIGVAVTVADEAPFHAKAARKIAGANHALRLIRNNNKVANFCCDVVGDICGTLSGSLGAAVALSLPWNSGSVAWLAAAVVAGLVAALTVGGKAISKAYAIGYANLIVDKLAVFIYVIQKPFKK